MPVEVVEKFESRLVTTGTSPSVELRYTIRGTNDDVAARNALVAGSPATYDPWGSGWFFLPRDTVSVQPIGEELWEGIVRYGPFTPTNESTFAFDTGGGTQHVTQSKQTIAKYPAGTAPDFKGAIGVTNDSVEGVDITVPVYQFAETHYLPDTTVTPAYRMTLFQLTGRVNSGAFKGFNAGEVLFLGASGSRRGYGDWEITFRFAASPNVTNLTIGDITGINKKGWEYLWVRYADSEDTAAKALVKKPIAVYIERVYDDGNLNLLGIGQVMGTTLKKVRSGDPLVIPAATFNAFVDVARDYQERQRSATRDGLPDWRQTGIVLVRNDSGADRQRFDVLGVAGTVINPTDNADAFKERVALKGVTPTAAHAGRFVILVEPVKSGLFGRGCVDGVCVARVKMNDEGHVFAEAKDGQADKLDSGAAGSACLLWIQPPSERDPDPTVAWVVAKIGLPTGAASMAAAFAIITSRSGSAPPYRYAAAQATMDEDGAWTQVGGGLAYNNVFNLEEQGAGGQWVNPLVVGDVVLIFAAPDPGVDAFVCTRSHYRGTY